MRGAPSLNDPLTGDQFDVSPDNHCTKHRKGAARRGIDRRGHTGESGELLRVEENLVDALRRGLQFDFLVKRGASLVCSGARSFFRVLLLLRLGPNVAAGGKPAKRRCGASDDLAAREGAARTGRDGSFDHHVSPVWCEGRGMKAHEPDDGQGGEAQLYHRLGAGRAWRRILATAFTFGVGPLLGLLTTLFPSITD